MSILNVDKIQPIGGGSTITVDATDIQASTGTITANSYTGVDNTLKVSIGGTEYVRTHSTGQVSIGSTFMWRTDTVAQVYGKSPDLSLSRFNDQFMIAGNETSGAINTGAGIQFFGHDGVSERGMAYIRGLKENGTSGDRASYLAFATRVNGGTLEERLRITSGGNIIFGSQTGSAVAVTSSAIKNLNLGSDYWNGTKGDYRAIREHIFYINPNDLYGFGISLNMLEIQSQQDIGFFAGTSGGGTGRREERLRITSDGDVAINRTTALNTAKFSLTKDADQQGIGVQLNQSSGITTSLTAYNSSGTNIFDLAHDTDSTPDLLFKLKHSSDAAPVEKVRIESGGGFKFTGQGTSIPVGGILHHTNNNLYVRGGTSGLVLGNQDNTNTIHISDSNYIKFETNDGTEKLRITSTGRVGIGEASPDNTLHITKDGQNHGIKLERTGTNAGSATINCNSFGALALTAGNNLALYSGGSQQITFHRGASTEIARFDTSGRLLIGTNANRTINSHTPALQISGDNYSEATVSIINNANASHGAYLFMGKQRSGSPGGNTIAVNGDIVGQIRFSYADGTDMENQCAQIQATVDGVPGSNDTPGRLSFYTTPDNSTALTERLRITNTGNIKTYRFNTLFGNEGLELFNTTTGGPQLQISRVSGNPLLLNRNTTDGEILDLRRGWGAGGSIHVGTNSATYNTSSDYRLKENVVPISDAITRLKTLKPSRFNWIGDANSTRDGFLAHEVTAVPEAITGTKDEVYSEDEPGRNIKAGDPKYQGIDQSRLVPLLTAALQEAVARIEALEGS